MLKVGVFGTGHLGKFHLNNWKEIKTAELVGFYDRDEDTVAPPPIHFAWCEKPIRKGKHVFVEKPLAGTMEEARELVQLVRESNVKLQVGHVERFNPAYLALQSVPLNPLFIEVHRLAQFNPRGTEVSVILDLMIHDIDIILSIVKSEVNNISASGVAV